MVFGKQKKATVEPDSNGGRAKEEEDDDFLAMRTLFKRIRGRYSSDLWASDVNKERRFSAQVRSREQREYKRVLGPTDMILINTRSQRVQAQHLNIS